VGDVHYDRHSRNRLKAHFGTLRERADLFLIAGDLTQSGDPEEAAALADDLRVAGIPTVIVLGNHDYHSNRQDEIRKMMQSTGAMTLEGETVTFRVREKTVGIMGIKGFGGGFAGACVSEFGEPETKAFAHYARIQADILRRGLESLHTDYQFVLSHYSPTESTLIGERREIYPFLGSYLLGEAIDAVGADGVFHGHAHMGIERGATPGGIPVRNVALNVIRRAYNVYSFDVSRRHAPSPGFQAAMASTAHLPGHGGIAAAIAEEIAVSVRSS
jgi:Icc-related predicted phosphoesterase